MNKLASIYFNGSIERAREYVEWVSRTYGPNEIIKGSETGDVTKPSQSVIFGTAAELLQTA